MEASQNRIIENLNSLVSFISHQQLEPFSRARCDSLALWGSSPILLFKNLPLLAAFLGLAIGFSIVGKERDYRGSFAPLFGLFIILVLLLGRAISPSALAYPGDGEVFVWHSAPVFYWVSLLAFLGVILVFFILIMLLFIPLGQSTGEEMAKHKPIQAYMVNILASLLGVWAFSLVSYLQTPPAIWFLIGVLGVSLYFFKSRCLTRLSIGSFIVGILIISIFGNGPKWSPYHRLELTDLSIPLPDTSEVVHAGFTLSVQQVFYQLAINLSTEFVEEHKSAIPYLEEMATSYDLPYTLVPAGSRVLIVGAGMGNDVAAALRNRMGEIDAVEIDPTIQKLGIENHPEKPYADDRVNPIVDDARSFFTKSDNKYDVIAFGLLDSHTLLSSLTSVRLNSFVYTIESFQQVRDHLKDDGIAVLTFATSTDWIEERLGRMLIDVFGVEHVTVHYSGLGTTFVAGNITPHQKIQTGLSAWNPDPFYDNLPLSTDDWPYLYLKNRTIPSAYWQSLLLVSIAGLALIIRSFPEALKPNWHFWLLGAAFLLIEFKSITELALLFGTTWLVNALAISGVLIMILFANLFVLWRKQLNLWVTYIFLFLSLALIYFIPLDVFSELTLLFEQS